MTLNNTPIATKLFYAPGFLLAVILGLAVATWAIFDAERKTLRELETYTVAQAARTAELARRVDLVHGAMFRILTWDSNGLNMDQVETLKESINAQRANLVGFENLAGPIDDYAAQVDAFMEAAEMDVYGALAVVQEADQAYMALQGPMAEARRVASDSAESSFVTARGRMDTTIIVYILAVVVALIVAVLVTVYIARGIIDPLTRAARNIDRIARNDYSSTFRDADRGDEVGAMVRQLKQLQSTAQEAEALRAEGAARAARDAERAAGLDAATKAFDGKVHASLNAFNRVMTDLRNTAENMAGAAGSVSHESGRLSDASGMVTQHMDSVTAALESMVDAVREISGQVQQASEISSRARDTGDRSAAELDSLAQAAERIGDVVTLINDIAGQTNLLALNATIEAARAGEAGKGFAVVASEVKNLANQTGKATEDISQQISGIQETTRTAVDAIGAMRDAIGEVDSVTTAIAAAIEEQDATTRDISDHVGSAAHGVSGVAEASLSLQTQAETGHGVSADLIGANDVLEREADTLRNAIEAFLKDVSKGPAA